MKMFAKVYALEPVESGCGGNGDWYRRTMVVETVGDDAKLIALDVFGERRLNDVEGLEQGQFVEVAFNIEARQHEGRWYNRVNMLSVKGYSAKV